MWLPGSMALYSTSPPGVWSTQCALAANSATIMDMDVLSRSTHNSASKPVVLGGLSSLFSSSTARHSSCSVSDGLEAPCLSCASGMVRSSSQTDLASFGGVLRDSADTRNGALCMPIASSLKLKDRSPVSVLHGPASVASSHGSQMFSLAAWENAGTTGLPSLDPLVDRVSARRRSSLSGESKLPLLRSEGFEVRGDRLAAAFRSRVLDMRRSEMGMSSSDSEASDCGDDLELEGLLSDCPPTGSVALDALTSRFLPSEREIANHVQGRSHDLVDSEGRSWNLAELDVALPSPLTTGLHVATIPLTVDQMLSNAQAHYKVFNNAMVVKAFEAAQLAHQGQFRRNGELYLSHCLETARILAATGADSTVVAAGLLHDTLDDSSFTEGQLRTDFGDEVADLVFGVSKLSKFSQLARDNRTVCNPVEADRLRTMFLAMVDARVVLIKLADRLHNMRTLDALPPIKQLRIADETLEIFAPLASRLGIWSWKAELEDLCFKYLKPQEHNELIVRVAEGYGEGELIYSIRELEQALGQHGVEFTDLSGRPKNLYSIYTKMVRKGRNIEEIFDYNGMRLIVQDEASCYAALEVVHKLWSHVPEKFKDYIHLPKTNGYQSLHTVVRGSDGHFLEVQIRTVAMHHQAEFGMAAHWRYKEGNHKYSSFILQRVEWARWVLTWQSEIMDTKVRVSPAQADLRPPCPFPFHKDGCPHSTVCYQPPQREDDPLFVIMLEDDQMVVQELIPGCTAADLMVERRKRRDRRMDSIRASSSGAMAYGRAKVNCVYVEDFHQKLRMGDLVEFADELELAADSAAKVLQPSGSPGERCGQIAVEFQREQLKRLYLDGGDSRWAPGPRLDRTPSSLAGLS